MEVMAASQSSPPLALHLLARGLAMTQYAVSVQ